MDLFRVALILLLAAGIGASAPLPDTYRLLGQFTPKVFRILDEAKWPAGHEIDALLTRDGRLIARVAPAFRRQLDSDGSARLRDGRIVNLDEKVDGSWRYVVAHDAPFGLGAKGYKLIPYRTASVDPKDIALGSVLYVPALAGVRLPSGEVHDGLVLAHDIGPGSTKDHRDLAIFVGFEDSRDNTLTRSGFLKDPITVYRVDARTASRVTERFKEQFIGTAAPGPPAAVPPGSRLLGKFVPTAYRILGEAEWPVGNETVPLLTSDGRLIARVSPVFKQRLDTEGSARLRDGRIVNFDEKGPDGWRYLVPHGAPFGLGAEDYKLIPYRTVAVDPKRIRLGSVLYLPSLAGVRLSSGEVHDGFVFAHDIGQGIIGNRIDIFVGFDDDLDNALTRSRRLTGQPIAVYQANAATAARLAARFKPQFAQ